MGKVKVATVWMAGCSGCHMSFLDLDEWLFELVKHVEVVYTPVADIKEYPENVDVALVEGAVANEENFHFIKQVRERTKLLISFGDCAVTANVPSMRNALGSADIVLNRAFGDPSNLNPKIPDEVVPKLLNKVLPVHQVAKVDFFLPGCPPPAARIQAILESLLAGEMPPLEGRRDLIKFG